MRLIRRFVFWFAEYFPFLFPLLLAAFFLVHINSALAADEVPADSVPAQQCTVKTATYGDKSSRGCDWESVASAVRGGKPEPSPPNFINVSWSFSASGPTSTGSTSRSWGYGFTYQQCSAWNYDVYPYTCASYNGLPWGKKFTVIETTEVEFTCPPDANPGYTVGPLTKDDGSKWCAKEPVVNTCGDKADTRYDSGVNFYALNLSDGLLPTCKEGCEVVSNGTGVCLSITLPSGTKANKCTYSSAMFTGNQCPFEVGEEPATGTGDDVGTPEQPSNTEQDCVPSYDAATGITSCTGVKKTENPGTSSCGSINGTWTCVPNNDGGSSTTTDHREITNSTDPVTGNTTTTDRTTSSTVTCKGDDCTTSAKTTTTTTVKGPDGSVISSSTDCVGAGCGSGAPGDPDAPEDELTPPEYPDMPNPQDFTDDVNEGVDGYEDEVMKQFEMDDYDYVATIDKPTSDKVAAAITSNAVNHCSNPTIPVGPWTFTMDMCYYSSKIMPYLDFMCVMFTLIYCWHLLREAIYATGA